MVFAVVGGTQSTGDFITNSLRFNEQDDAKLSFDPDSAGNVDTMTISFWIKPDLNFGGDHNNIFSVRPSAGAYAMLVHRTGGEILFEHSGAGDILKTNRLFRDPSAWYHIVLALDSTNGTAAQRARLYVNGVEETSFATDNRANHSQNTDFLFGGGNPHQISGDPTGNYFYGGYLADFYYVNGTQLAPTSFGETNDNGVWVPIKYTGAYGTNGFHLEFKQTGTSANASGIGADTSGSGNHFTPTNLAATDITTDTPQNNFATLNPLNSSASVALSEGNTKHTNSGANDQASAATMGFTKGKWYWEVKCVDKAEVGINLNSDILQLSNDSTVGSNDANIKATSLITNSAGGSNDLRHNGSNESITSVSVADGDIISVAVDADNGKIWFAKNGTYFNSGDPAAGSNEAKDFSGAYTSGNFITPVGLIATGDGDIFEINFGNPSFSISSGNFDGAGYGNFEYAVPSGYYSLCTKNLAEYG